MPYKSIPPEKSKVKGVSLEKVEAIRMSNGWWELVEKPSIVPAYVGGARFGSKPWAIRYVAREYDGNKECEPRIVNLANIIEISEFEDGTWGANGEWNSNSECDSGVSSEATD